MGCLYTTQDPKSASLHPFQDLWLADIATWPHYTPSRTCGLLIHHPGPKVSLTTPLPGPVGYLYSTQDPTSASLHPFQDLQIANTATRPHYTPSRTCGLFIHHPGPKISLTTPLPGPVGCFYTTQASLHPFQDLALTGMVGDGRLEGELVVHRP